MLLEQRTSGHAVQRFGTRPWTLSQPRLSLSAAARRCANFGIARAYVGHDLNLSQPLEGARRRLWPRTGFGKSDRPGSLGGSGKHRLRRN